MVPVQLLPRSPSVSVIIGFLFHRQEWHREITDGAYLGDWEITNVGTELTLANRAFNLESTDGLTYIVGNAQRLLGRDIAVAHILDGNSTGVTDEKSLRWDTYVGETVTVPQDGRTHTASMTLGIDPGNGGTEHLIDVDIVPSSFSLEPVEKCTLSSSSDLHTDAGGRVNLVINTVADVNATEVGTCTVTWNGSNASIYLEY